MKLALAYADVKLLGVKIRPIENNVNVLLNACMGIAIGLDMIQINCK